MAIEAGRMVVSAGNIEWLNFDFTKAMPPKELITGYSTFDIQSIEGEDTLEVDVTYGAQDRVFEELNFRLASIKGMQLVSKVETNGQFSTLDASTHYYEFDTAYFQDAGVIEVDDNDENDVQIYRLTGDISTTRYAKHPTPFSPPGVTDYLFYREVRSNNLPAAILSSAHMKDVGGFAGITYSAVDEADPRRYDPQYPISLIEIYDEENDDAPFTPPRYRVFHAFQTLPVAEQKTNATDPTRKIVSLAVRGKAKLGPDGNPERVDKELDSIWLVNCRIRTSPGGLTRSGSMLVVGSG